MGQEQQYLIGILKAYATGAKPPKADNVDWNKLSTLAQIHNLFGIVGYMDMQHRICPREEWRGGLRKVCMNTMVLFTQRGALAKELFQKLSENGIRHCPMKGIEIRELYPIPELRSFSDVDLLIHPEDREKCHQLMLSLGYEAKNDWEPVYSYQKDIEYYEIHTRIMEVDISGKADYRGYFDRAWEHTSPVSEFGYRFSPEFHFIYLLTHIAKHAQGCGAGIRMYLDIAFFLRHYRETLDWSYVRTELESLALWDFACTVLSAVESWFGTAVPMEYTRISPELLERFTEYTMEAGTFGHFQREAGLNSLKKGEGSRISILMKRAFPKAETLQSRYTYLQEHKWLLPVAWVHRFFKTDISLADHAKEARDILTEDAAEVDRLQSICRDIGL